MKTLKCILLVDDDEINNIICYSHLNRLGIAEKIQTASNGINALNFLRRYYMQYKCLPELIILDIEMPVMDGLEFLKAFNNSFFIEKNNTSIVFLSNYPSETQKYILKSGDFLTLEKPLDERQLDIMIDYHFNVAIKKREQEVIKKLFAKAG